MVDRAVGVELVAVLVEHRAEAGDVVALRLDDVRVDEAEPHRAERFEVGRVDVGVGPGLHGHERLDAAADVPLVDEREVAVGAPQDVVAERVQRADAVDGRRGEVGEAFAHRVLGAHVVGDGGDRAGAPVARDEQPEPFGEDARLARARGRDDARRARVVQHRFELVGRELGVGCRRRGRA